MRLACGPGIVWQTFLAAIGAGSWLLWRQPVALPAGFPAVFGGSRGGGSAGRSWGFGSGWGSGFLAGRGGAGSLGFGGSWAADSAAAWRHAVFGGVFSRALARWAGGLLSLAALWLLLCRSASLRLFAATAGEAQLHVLH